MNLLFTIDKNYLPYFVTAMRSLEDHNEGCQEIYILSKDVKEDCALEKYFKKEHHFHYLDIQEDILKDAPVTTRYPETIYYRIFAAKILPQELDRILYLDPDIIVNGSLEELYQMPFNENYYVATTNVKAFLTRFNQIKNHAAKDTVYVNTGILLMNLDLLRKNQSIPEVYQYIEKQKAFFILPDQDIISTLYGNKILLVDKLVYNLSDRAIAFHNAFNKEKIDLDWVKKNAKIIHYYGTNKPWNDNYKGILKPFYDNYQ